MVQNQGDEGFTVSDKRHFTTEGEIREQKAGQPDLDAKAGPAAEEPMTPPPQGPSGGVHDQIDFPSYILTYYTQGLVLLGDVPNPYTNKKEENLDAARHTIDILAMLQAKTRGNLTPDEDHLLDGVLYELRMKFMAKTNRIKL